MNPLVAVPITLLLIFRAWSRKSLTPLGILVATVTAVAHAVHPWSVFFACLVVFFLGGTAVTKVKHDVKAQLTLSSTGVSGGEGPRTAVQVLANSAVASVLILLHARQLKRREEVGGTDNACWAWGGDLLVVGIIANYAAVAADTFSSELGILSKSRPRLITSPTLRQVPPGTNGGVTMYGLCAGLLGSATIALTSVLLLPFCHDKIQASVAPKLSQGSNGVVGIREKLLWIAAVTLWGGLGSLVDSLLGGWLQASVIDLRTGKVVEGDGGRKVPVEDRRALSNHLPTSDRHGHSSGVELHHSGLQNRRKGPTADPSGQPSRRVESGLGIIDNNVVNFLMALIMSVIGMLAARWCWGVGIPFSTALL